MSQLIAVVGPTASGKTSLAIDLARKYNGEIICADSRTVYKDMDIGTAKPNKKEQAGIAHHLLDVVSPDQSYSASQFQADSKVVINDVIGRNKLPIVVGGSGLYIEGLLYDFKFGEPQPEIRAKLLGLSLEQLQDEAQRLNINVSEQTLKNPRHLMRAIERGGGVPSKTNLSENYLIIGLRVKKDILDQRIEQRVDTMLANGLINEARDLNEKYGSDAPALLAPGYKAFGEYINGTLSVNEAKRQFIRNDKQLAKRQMTWFKRNKDIQWVDNKIEAEQIVETFLSKFATIPT